MPDGRSPNHRFKILYLYKILMEMTDEEHSISMPEIQKQLELYGITAGRKALYEDIEALKNFGLDIVSGRGNKIGYAVVNREFQLPELRLLADAVSSARFLTEKKSNELLKKLGTLASVHQRKQISRNVYNAGRVKAMNENIYINTDIISRAIDEKKRISFLYYNYNARKEKVYRESRRVCSPYALAWNDERYYLVSFYSSRPENMTNFRVDRMERVEILPDDIIPPPENFSVARHISSSFSMFSGHDTDVRIRFVNSLVGAVIDRFGKSVRMIPDGDEHFVVCITVKADTPQPFFGWLFQFGTDAQLIYPEDLRSQYIDFARRIVESYAE